jgi:hypothetical protein
MTSKDCSSLTIGMESGHAFMSIQPLVTSHRRRLRDRGYVRVTGSEILVTISKYIATNFL